MLLSEACVRSAEHLAGSSRIHVRPNMMAPKKPGVPFSARLSMKTHCEKVVFVCVMTADPSVLATLPTNDELVIVTATSVAASLVREA